MSVRPGEVAVQEAPDQVWSRSDVRPEVRFVFAQAFQGEVERLVFRWSRDPELQGTLAVERGRVEVLWAAVAPQAEEVVDQALMREGERLAMGSMGTVPVGRRRDLIVVVQEAIADRQRVVWGEVDQLPERPRLAHRSLLALVAREHRGADLAVAEAWVVRQACLVRERAEAERSIIDLRVRDALAGRR